METYWGLARNPFVAEGGGVSYVATPVLEEASARLDYLCSRRRRLGVVLGEAGAGKTVTLRAFRRELATRGEAVALMTAAGCDGDEALYRFADAFGALRPGLRTPTDVRRALGLAIENLALLERPFVLLVDDLARAGEGFVAALIALVKRGESVEAPLSIAAATSPFDGAGDANLRDAIDLVVRLSPWSPDDVRQVLSDALAAAGRTTKTFDDQAILRIHELSGGTPRFVVRLSEMALVAGAAERSRLIGADLVDAIAAEVLPPTSPPRFDGIFAESP